MPACHSLTTALPLLLYGTAGKDRRIVAQRNPRKIEGMKKKKKKTPPGLIKCLINSRRRIGRNNEHLSESLIACKSLFPASSHLIFTAGLGGRYYHYLHFIGEERKALTPPRLSGQAVHLGGGAAVKAVRTSPPAATGSPAEHRLRLLPAR